MRTALTALVALAALASAAASRSAPAADPPFPQAGLLVLATGANDVIGVRPNGSGRRILGSVRGTPLDLSPDGTRILVAKPSAGGGTELWVQRVAGDDSTSRRIARAGTDPSWSADGRSVLYASGRQLRRVGADGRGRRTLFAVGDPISEPVLSHTGSRVVFVAARRLWVARPDGTQRRPVGRRTGMLPRWSPGDARITLVDASGISLVDWRTGRGPRIFEPPVRTATEEIGVTGYAWSPDGRFLAVSTEEQYACDEDPTGPCTREAIWLVRVSDGARRMVHAATASAATAGAVLGWLPP